VGFQILADKVTSVSIPAWVYTFSKRGGGYQSRDPNTNKTKYFTPVYGSAMSERIGHARIEIKEIERKEDTPLQDSWQGKMLLEENEEDFSTDIASLSSNESYFAVYERTETLMGDPIVKIHELTDVQNKKARSAQAPDKLKDGNDC
jgi:hypothetical protein